MEAQRISLLVDHAEANALPHWMSQEQFRTVVQQADGLLDVLQALCRRGVQSTPAVDGAGLILQFRGRPLPLVWTAPWVREIDEHQCRDGDGPGLQSLRLLREVACDTAALRTGWPSLTEAVIDVRIRAVHAEPLPIQSQPAAQGVLTLYSTARTVIEPQPDRLKAMTDLLTDALTGYCEAHPHEDHVIRLHRELYNRQLLLQAIEILMARHKVSEDPARRMLTEQTAHSQVTASSAARALIRQHVSWGHGRP